MIHRPETDQPPLPGDARQRRLIARRRRRDRTRRRILRSTAMLPAMCTVLNGLSGFAALHFATKDGLGVASLSNLTMAAWFIFAAMVFDMLDGRLARLTRHTSDFGAQLDSLSDAISFGVAPAMLMLRTVVMTMREYVDYLAVERLVWCAAGAYMACAILRLARFNVENLPDESHHMDFRGLPSPGAAAVVGSLVLLLEHADSKGWIARELLYNLASVALPALSVAAALLMVSRFRYPHLMNRYFRGKRPFNYLVKMVIIVLAAIIEPFIAGAVAALAFVASGPVGGLWRALHKQPAEARPG